MKPYSRRQQSKLCMRRLRAERRGELSDAERISRVPKERRERLWEGGLIFSFDDIGDPIHGDALERLEALCSQFPQWHEQCYLKLV